MTSITKVVLHSRRGDRRVLDMHVAAWIQEGVKYVGVVGIDASAIEDIIDELCVGDGSDPYRMLTASHGPDETLEDAILFAEQLSNEFAGEIRVVDL